MDNYGINYGELKAGIYLQRGGNIKQLDVVNGSNMSWLEMLGFNKAVDDDTLANQEAWTYISLAKRAEQLIGTPFSWVQGEQDVDAPFGINMRQLLPQIDKAIQIKEWGAFLYKYRMRGGGLRIIWMNPDTIEPDLKTASHEEGVTRFWRTNDDGQRKPLPAKDVIWLKRPGQTEIKPDPAPLEASRLSAEVLYNIAQMEDSFYETSGLPYMLIMVPQSIVPAEKERLRDNWKRLFNSFRNPREIKTVVTVEGVSVEILSFTPNDLDLPGTKDSHRESVLGVHHVPESIARSNAANYATAISDQIQFANTMATRFEAIAEVFNEDADIKAAGFALDVRRNELPVNQEEERQRAQAFSLYVNSGIHPEAAMAMLGIDLPENYAGDIFAEAESEPMPVEPEPDEMELEDDSRKMLELDRLNKFIKNGTYLKRAFTSDVLTVEEIRTEIAKEAAGQSNPANFRKTY